MSRGSTKTSANTLQDGLNVGAAISPPNPTRKFQQCDAERASSSFIGEVGIARTFISPTGTVILSKIWRPYNLDNEPVWFVDVSFSSGWKAWPENISQAGLWRFVSVMAPTIHDSAGKALALSAEPGAGSIIKIAGTGAYKDGRTVLTVRAISIVELVEEPNLFSLYQDTE
jgi:hypothetical protein